MIPGTADQLTSSPQEAGAVMVVPHATSFLMMSSGDSSLHVLPGSGSGVVTAMTCSRDGSTNCCPRKSAAWQYLSMRFSSSCKIAVVSCGCRSFLKGDWSCGENYDVLYYGGL